MTRDVIVLNRTADPARPIGRPEPQIDPARAKAPPNAVVRLIRRGIAVFIERREPHVDLGRHPDERSLFSHAILSQAPKRRRWLIATLIFLSLLLHAAFILSARFYLFGGGTDDSIPVQLVLEPTQPNPAEPPKPEPKPPSEAEKQKQEARKEEEKPPPRGRLASDELGDPNATGKQPTPTHAPAAGKVEPKPGEAPPPPAEAQSTQQAEDVAKPTPPQEPQQSDAVKQENLPETREQVAAAGTLAPPPIPTAPEAETAMKPTRKPSPVRLAPPMPGGARLPTQRPDDLSHGEGHKAPYPGPDASFDEYLAYLKELTMERLAALPAAPFEGRSGVAEFHLIIRPSGAIVWFSLVKSSGYSDADRLVSDALNSIKEFPPLPAHLLNPDGSPVTLTFNLQIGTIPTLAKGGR